MKELFKIVNKKNLLKLLVINLIINLTTYGVSFAYAKYITSPLTTSKLFSLIIAMIILYTINLFFTYFNVKYNEKFFYKTKYDIELYYFEKLDNMDFNKLNDNHTGFIYNLIDRTAYSFYRIIDGIMQCYLPLIIGLISLITMTLNQSLYLGIILFVIYTLAIIVRYIMTKKREPIKKRMWKNHASYRGTFIDFASNILTVRKLHIEPFAKKTLDTKSEIFYDDLQLAEKKLVNLFAVFEIFIDISYMIILLTLLNDARNGIDVLPYLVFYVSIIGKVTSALNVLTKTLDVSIRFKSDKENLTDAIGNLSYKRNSRFDKVEVRDGKFTYPKKRQVIQIPEFTLNKNDKISVMGESGQGKSTILNILAGFYSLNEGKILINDKVVDNNTINPVFISQEVELFDLSIRDNLCLGKDISTKKIEELLKEAGLYEWYQKLPNGLDEMVGEKGVKLSAGQKQRLNIIRGILIDSDLYFFDEPTSNLDKESEEKIIHMIDKYLHDKTYIVVTHRDAIKELCNRHYIFENHTMKEIIK